jgi:hypothetical protein
MPWSGCTRGPWSLLVLVLVLVIALMLRTSSLVTRLPCLPDAARGVASEVGSVSKGCALTANGQAGGP